MVDADWEKHLFQTFQKLERSFHTATSLTSLSFCPRIASPQFLKTGEAMVREEGCEAEIEDGCHQ